MPTKIQSKKCFWCKKRYYKCINICSQQWKKSRFCSRKCAVQYGSKVCKNYLTGIKARKEMGFSQYGKKNNNWQGGKYLSHQGYWIIWIGRGKPMANKKGYVLLHRYIVGRHLGRPLKRGEVVHHKNGIITDNRFRNLKLFRNHQEHTAYHRSLDRKKSRMTKITKCLDNH